jgi:hypothetical protein
MEEIQNSNEDKIEATFRENATPIEAGVEADLSSKKAPDIIYRVALRCNGVFSGKFYEPDVFIDEMERLGFSFVGREDRGYLKKELQGQPYFNGLAGPFWNGLNDDGRLVILYEDEETYRICSL